MFNQFFFRAHFVIPVICFFITLSTYAQNSNSADSIEFRINTLLKKMTLEEKIGQMNQYNGFWEVTGPAPKEGNA